MPDKSSDRNSPNFDAGYATIAAGFEDKNDGEELDELPDNDTDDAGDDDEKDDIEDDTGHDDDVDDIEDDAGDDNG